MSKREDPIEFCLVCVTAEFSRKLYVFIQQRELTYVTFEFYLVNILNAKVKSLSDRVSDQKERRARFTIIFGK